MGRGSRLNKEEKKHRYRAMFNGLTNKSFKECTHSTVLFGRRLCRTCYGTNLFPIPTREIVHQLWKELARDNKDPIRRRIVADREREVAGEGTIPFPDAHRLVTGLGSHFGSQHHRYGVDEVS